MTSVKVAYGSNDFFHGNSEKYDEFQILALLYANDLVAIYETAEDLEKIYQIFRKSDTEIWLDYEY